MPGLSDKQILIQYTKNIQASDKFAQIAVFLGETEHLTWADFLSTFAAGACRQCALRSLSKATQLFDDGHIGTSYWPLVLVPHI